MHRTSNRVRSSTLRLLALVLLFGGLSWANHAGAQSYLLTPNWSVPPKTNTFINNDNNCRGLAFNPATGHLLVVSRSLVPDFGTNVFGTNAVFILDASTGAVLGKLPFDDTVINGGTFAVNMVGVTDDGAIYVGNLTTDAGTTPFKLYRWANETAQPQMVYSGDPSNYELYGTNPRRFGDSLALRGTGANTQILLGTYNQRLALLTTTDGQAFNAALVTTTGMAAEDSRVGLAWGTGNTFWVKRNTGNLRQLALDLATSTAAVITNINVASTAGPFDIDLARKLIAFVDGTTHNVRLYDISDPSIPIAQDVARNFPTNGGNGNLTGAVTLRNNKLYALESNNGLLACTISETTLPATIATAPAAASLWEGCTYTITAAYGGTRPFSYQWRLAGTNIPGATTAFLTLSNLSYAQAGSYSVAVSNALGGAVSAAATITMTPANFSAQVTNLWNVQAGTRPYLTYRPVGDSVAGYRGYGLAINPVNTNIVVVTRMDPTNMIAVMDIKGNHLHYIDYSGIGVPTSGNPMNRVDVADDGKVYIGNLVTTTSSPFTVYAFDDDGPSPVRWLAYSGDPGNGQTFSTNGWGNTFSVRGSGADTEILIGHINAAFRTFAVLQADANFAFTSTLITVPDAPAGFCRLGLDWGPGNNTVWAKTASGNLLLIQFDLATGSGQVVTSYPQTMTLPNALRFVPSSVTAIKYDPATKLLAGLQNGTSPAPVSLVIYDVSDPDSGAFQVDQELFPTFNSDIEFTGMTDFSKGYLAALGVNNGVMICKVDSSFTSLPRILVQPVGTTSYRGTVANFSVVADSPAGGLSYQWYRNSILIPDAVSSTLSLTDLQIEQAGLYSVRVSNANGSRDSIPALLTVLEPVVTAQMTNIWSLQPGSRSYLNTDYKEYGMAFNPANSNLLVISLEGGGTVIAVLNALTGEDKHVLDVSTVTGGSKVLHKIDVADDGVVYAGNLTTAANSNPFKLYRWDNDNPGTVATVAFQGDPVTNSVSKAIGYTFDVRGAGANTEVILGTTTTTNVSILKTTDGKTFAARDIKVTGAPNNFCRLGLAFGAGNTFWAKSWRDDPGAGRLYLVQYDLAAGTGTILNTYQTTQFSSTITTIAYNNNLKLLSGIANDNQKNVMVYDIANLVAGPQLRDQELFPVFNPSIEANGDLDYGGDTYLFALSENNGIMAFRINAKYANFKIVNVTPTSGSTTLTWEAVPGAKYQVQRASTVNGAWSDTGTAITANSDTATYTDSTPDPSLRFYRVIAR